MEKAERRLTFVLDVDGVFSDGTFYYTEDGKVAKKYGPDDNEALKLIADKLDIIIVSGDKRGFKITEKRVNDMGFPLMEVPGGEARLKWIEERFCDLDDVIYMGDGLKDALVLKNVGYGIATATSCFLAKRYADYVTECGGGERAVSEAVFHIADRFFGISPEELIGLK